MNPRKDLSPRLAALQDQLGDARGKKYWRSLEELADTEAFQELMRQEYPEQAPFWPQSLSRRQFLSLMGASLALAGLSGCSVRPAPTRTLVPHVRAPEERVPGRPLFYATAMTLGGSGVGLLVESHMGRPTKIEGNPEHPASLGATDPFHQASVLGLYDPDRSQTVTHLGQTRTWDEGFTALRGALERQRQDARRGAGLRILTETVVSPTLGQQLTDLLRPLPNAKWHQYEPLGHDAAHRGAVQAFGAYVNTCHDFRHADVVLSLDADFLTGGPGNLRYVADFMGRRRVRTTAADAGRAQMNRLYAIETTVTNTGAKADHRLAVRAGDIEGLARALAARLGVQGAGGAAGPHERWVSAVARDLEQHHGGAGARLDRAGPRRPLHHRRARLRPRQRGPGRRDVHAQSRLQRLPSAHLRAAVVRPRPGGAQDRRHGPRRLHAAAPPHGEPRPRPRGRRGTVSADAALRVPAGRGTDPRADRARRAPAPHPVRAARLPEPQVGHGHRPDDLHRLQGARHGLHLPGGSPTLS